MQPEHEHVEENKNLIDFLKFTYLPYWPLFVIFLGLSLIGAYFYMRYATPLYQSTSEILIKDEKKGTDDSKLIESLNIYNTKKIVEDEIQVLQSPTIIKQVVRKLHLYAPVFEKGNIKSWSAYITSPVSVEIDDFDSLFSGHQKVFIDKQYFTYDDFSKKVNIGNRTYSLYEWIKYDFGNIRFVPNLRNAKAATRPLFFTLVNPKLIADEIAKSVDIEEVSKLSTVVDLTIRDEVPQRGEDILNGIVVSYNNAGISDKNQLVVNTLSFLKERLDFVKNELDSVEMSIQSYKTNRGIVDLGGQSATVLKNVGDNNQKVADAKVQLAVLEEVEKYVDEKNNKSGIIPASLGVTDPGLSSLLQKLYDANTNYERLKNTIGENNPMVTSLGDEIAKIRPAIMENIRIQKVGLAASLKGLDLTNNTYSAQLQGVPQKERGLLEITRQEAILNSVYSFLLQKREESALAYASTVPDSRTVNLAESTIDPVSPRRMIVLIIAVVGALLTGIIVITLKDFFKTKVIFRKEIAGLTPFPVLGEISHLGKTEDLFVVQEEKNRAVSEEFRHFRTALGIFGKYDSRKKILFTSGISGEGKSFISANMALSLALAGKKTILLDFDLRNPEISYLTDMDRELGISDFLLEEREPYEIIKRSFCRDLFFISAGKSSSQCRELSFNKKLGILFEYLEQVFDFIIIDSSPIESVSDAYVLSQYCDSTIYVVRHNYTPKMQVKLLAENFKLKPLKNLSLVFNDVKSRGLIKGRYGMEYGYGYENFHKQNKPRVRKPQFVG